jgi:hypothetical protein
VVTLRSWPGGERDDDGDKLRTLMVGAVVAVVVLICLMGFGMGVVGLIAGSDRQPAIDPDQTVTFRGQVFGHFQSDERDTSYGVAENVRGIPLQFDPLWTVIPPRDEITINGLVYGDCEGQGPVVQARLTYRELVCHRMPRT